MIGAIADDVTGATDVAVAFRRAGLRAMVLFGMPTAPVELPPHDAVVIGLKTRTIPPGDAVRQSLAAAEWLQKRGARQFYFKYCSTFDSRPDGNIGPVADALASRLGAEGVVMVPASPEHGRTQFLGHLFVGDVLLSESPMRHHPLTPMTDSLIPRVLERQTSRGVALVPLEVVRGGIDAIADELTRLRDRGIGYAVVDAIEGRDLAQIGVAVADDVLVGGGAGLAGGLAAAVARERGAEALPADPVGSAPAVAIAGSCSARTVEQVATMRASHDSYFLDAIAVPDATALARGALDWYDAADRTAAPPLIYSSVRSDQLRRVQRELGAERASLVLEEAAGAIARGLADRGVRRLVIAGGETSGAVVGALDVIGGAIGAEESTGVPWIYTAEPPLALLLKSGNFGDPALLVRAVSAGQDAELLA